MLFAIVVFVLVLSVLVFVHELGHFWTAKKLGVAAQEFGFGFPPRVFGWKKFNGKRKFFWGDGETESEDTIYSVNWIPLGGFVRIKGESGDNTDPDSFAMKKIWHRFIILSAGVTMNVLLAMVCLMIVYWLGAPQSLDNAPEGIVAREVKIQIMQILPDGVAAEIGLNPGDVLLSLDDNSFTEVESVQHYIAENADKELHLVVGRLEEQLNFAVTPTYSETAGKKGLGVALAKVGIVSYPWYESIWLGIKGAVVMLWQILFAFYSILRNLFIGQPVGVEVAGPVGIAVMTGQVARMGLNYILQFAAMLSLNLAVINFLPLPALDGGRVLFLLIEKIRGRAVDQKIERVVHATGFALLMALIVLVTGRDLWNLKDGILGLFSK